MGEPFDAVGFSVNGEQAYHKLAEQARAHGAHSQTQRDQTTLHGYCWNIGDGLEIWTVIHESAKGSFYADCRPAWRGRQVFRMFPWEITEYEEDGQAVVRGSIISTQMQIVFELQNLTELDLGIFRERMLAASISGLTYHLRINKTAEEPKFRQIEKVSPRRRVAENDYSVRGQILDFRILTNSQTTGELVSIYADFGQVRLELLVNRQDIKGELSKGAYFSAEIWLQGYILTDKELESRYEGVDFQFEPGDYWVMLRREN